MSIILYYLILFTFSFDCFVNHLNINKSIYNWYPVMTDLVLKHYIIDHLFYYFYYWTIHISWTPTIFNSAWYPHTTNLSKVSIFVLSHFKFRKPNSNMGAYTAKPGMEITQDTVFKYAYSLVRFMLNYSFRCGGDNENIFARTLTIGVE